MQMYDNRSAFIDTAVGTGEAIVGTPSYIDLSGAGFKAATNSKEFKRTINARQTQNVIDDIKVDGDGIIPFHKKDLDRRASELREWALEPKDWSDPKEIQELDRRAKELDGIQQSYKMTGKLYYDKLGKIGSENHQNYEGVDAFLQMGRPDYDLNPFIQGGDIDDIEMNAMVVDAINDVRKVVDSDWRKKKIPTYTLNEYSNTKEVGDNEITNKSFSLSNENLDKARVLGGMMYDSGRNQANGSSIAVDEYDKALYEEGLEYVMNAHATEINAAKTPEERENIIRERVIDFFVSEVESHNKVKSSSATKPKKEDSGGLSDSEKALATKYKKVVNMLQDGDLEAANQQLAEDPIRFTRSGEGFVLEALSGRYDKEGEAVYKPVSGVMSPSSPKQFYRAIGNNIKGVSEGDINSQTFDDNTPGKPKLVAGSKQDKELDADIEFMFNSYTNGTEEEAKEIAKKFGPDVEYIENAGDDEIKVGENKYDIDNPDHRKELYKVLKKEWVKNSKAGSNNSKEAWDGYKIGQVDSGYKYTGGDPSKEENWKKI